MVDNTSRAVTLYLENLPLKVCGVLSDIKSLHVTYEYQLSAQQQTQQMEGEYLTFFQNYTRSKLSIAQNQTFFFDQFNQPKGFSDLAVILAITVYERCAQDFSVVKTQGSSTSFSFSYHSAISENLFKSYFSTAPDDFRVPFSINLIFSPDILGIQKALEHNAMSSSVSVVRSRKVLYPCKI